MKWAVAGITWDELSILQYFMKKKLPCHCISNKNHRFYHLRRQSLHFHLRFDWILPALNLSHVYFVCVFYFSSPPILPKTILEDLLDLILQSLQKSFSLLILIYLFWAFSMGLFLFKNGKYNNHTSQVSSIFWLKIFVNKVFLLWKEF
jgi:hypothetical protein